MIRPLTLVAALLLAAPAYATTVLPLSRTDLAARADTVVRARVLGQAPARSARSRRILTRTRLAVLEVYKGSAPARIELEQLGGTLDGATLRVPGDATLGSGEEAVLYLRCRGRERCHLVGLGLGKYAVRTDPRGRRVAERDLRELTDPHGRPLDSAPVPFEALERELRRLR